MCSTLKEIDALNYHGKIIVLRKGMQKNKFSKEILELGPDIETNLF